ncbi:glutathione S-transferase family protein [Paralimibaculum aggregatum]|uniref:Glutathione S-transferase family protein n=1 Tax=Paralimibaculum aggregatum TaxID=3036245 RepID=A0ABQ6LLB7_9RHOB|nr:glutathione S-transferase family protein [Limibaculum sp. NKW23]GMG83075.1 glutathione S-transferase family protein [Limibaculum sp. NKW23]
MSLTLVSHPLCPYVQRAAIAMAETGTPFKRVWIDLADKPDWFRKVSPLDKVPVLLVDMAGRREALFESAAILEYLEETSGRPLHPADPVTRARHRAWIEAASRVLDRIAEFYNAREAAALAAAGERLAESLAPVAAALGKGPYFAGQRFTLVDAAFAPVFRYFETFERLGAPDLLAPFPGIAEWRAALAARPSVRAAVGADYPARLEAFLRARQSALIGAAAA